MTEMKINFKPSSGFSQHTYIEQMALAVNKWSDEYKGKNLFYLYDGGNLDIKLASEAAVIICPTMTKFRSSTPLLEIDDFDAMVDGSVVTINSSGKIRILFNPASLNNAFFVTDACNNYCIMCPQPPKPIIKKNTLNHLHELLYLIRNRDAPEILGVTGGEPTTIKGELLSIIESITNKFPSTIIQLLTNGRFMSYGDYAEAISKITKKIFVCIPIFGATPDKHDFIVQSRGAFEQTLAGLYECKRHKIDIELRIVLHKLTVEDLDLLVEFIHRNLPFVGHVAFMGMENMGFAKQHYSELWIDPIDYKEKLRNAVKYLAMFGMSISVFNLPLCIMDKDIWSHCKQSISDFKTKYYTQCGLCTKRKDCSGFFSSTTEKFPLTHPQNINAIKEYL